MNINDLLRSIGEDALNEQTRAHDNARASYMLHDVTVRDWQEFEHCLEDYYRHHCQVVGGGDMGSSSQNLAKAKVLACSAPRRKCNIKQLYRNANTGADGGMRQVLDNIANAIQHEYIERYVTDTFDRYISPCNEDEQIEIMRQFLNKFQQYLPAHINIDDPRYYAVNYVSYINTFAQSLANLASSYREL